MDPEATAALPSLTPRADIERDLSSACVTWANNVAGLSAPDSGGIAPGKESSTECTAHAGLTTLPGNYPLNTASVTSRVTHRARSLTLPLACAHPAVSGTAQE